MIILYKLYILERFLIGSTLSEFMLEHVLIAGRGPVASFLVDQYREMGVTPIIAAVQGDNW